MFNICSAPGSRPHRGAFPSFSAARCILFFPVFTLRRATRSLKSIKFVTRRSECRHLLIPAMQTTPLLSKFIIALRARAPTRTLAPRLLPQCGARHAPATANVLRPEVSIFTGDASEIMCKSLLHSCGVTNWHHRRTIFGASKAFTNFSSVRGRTRG